MSEKIPVKVESSKPSEIHIHSQEHLRRAEVSRAEKAAEHSKGRKHETEHVRHEVKEHAISGAEYHKPQSEQRQPNPVHTKKDKDHAFDTVMHHVRSEMSAPERTFSRFIHKPAVEKTSEFVGKTVARPSGITGAAVAAALGLFSVYSIARFAGFQLSGSEMPLLLAGGFIIGLITEWFYKSVRSVLLKRS